ncbi:MAG: hypothetical protein KatS3mg008_0614 [Acidimicrobiales bacterium]|nr:MAG: hypothetical protein KatS3mg008_0614 [Acidimicrobiales bacterium]
MVSVGSHTSVSASRSHSRFARLCELRNRFAPVSALAAVAAIVSLRDPHTPGAYGLCPFKALTGMDCPGCGSLRALRHLAAGDFVGALDHNALIPPLVIVGGLWALGVAAGRTLLPRVGPERAHVALTSALFVLFSFTALRNLPTEPFTHLASGA